MSKRKVKDIIKREVLVYPEAYEKMRALVLHIHTEVQWVFHVRREWDKKKDEPLCYFVNDVFCFPQYCSGTATTTLPTEYFKWQDENDLPELRGHGHSHVFMRTFRSKRDCDYQQEIINNLPAGDFYLFFIMNKYEDMEATLWERDKNGKLSEFCTEEKTLKVRKLVSPVITEFMAKAANYVKPYSSLPKEIRLEQFENEFE